MGLVRMRNPKEFFDFDNPKYPWVYEGVVSYIYVCLVYL